MQSLILLNKELHTLYLLCFLKIECKIRAVIYNDKINAFLTSQIIWSDFILKLKGKKNKNKMNKIINKKNNQNNPDSDLLFNLPVNDYIHTL